MKHSNYKYWYTFVTAIGGTYIFWIFTGFSVLSFLFIWKIVPETKGKTLEEIEKYGSNR